MKNWTIKRRIIFGFASIITLVAVMAVVSFFLLRGIEREVNFIKTDLLPCMKQMGEISAKVNDIQIKVLRTLITKNPAERLKTQEEIAGMRAEILKVMDEYEKLITNPEDRALFDKLKVARDNYIAARKQIFELVNAEKIDDAIAFNVTTLRPSFLAYQGSIDKLVDFNIKDGDEAAVRSETAAQRANLLVLGSCVAVIVLGTLFATLIVISLNRALSTVASTLSEGSAQVAAAAHELSSASQSLAEGSSEQAASLQETSASLEEVASMTRRNAQNAVGAKDFTARTRKTTETSAASTREMGSAMAGIRTASQEMRDAMNGIKSASGDVSKIIKTIDEIAFQTNILALNAAVEAARAGEAGMGFAVVADEVRNLAQRSARAAKETTDMIETSIKRSEDGVRVTDKVAGAVEDVSAKAKQLEEHLTEILANVQQVDEQVGQIASASQEQSTGISQVSTAVSQMDKVTQSTAANAEETASAAEELNAQSAVLKDAVNQLQKLVTGHSTVTESRPVPSAPARKAHTLARSKPVTLRAHGNGASHRSSEIPLETAGVGAKGELPLPDDRDFKNF